MSLIEEYNEKRAKAAGTSAPTLALLDQHGTQTTLKQLLNDGMALLFFYSKDGAPGVSDELAQLNTYRERFQQLGITPVGISQDDVETHKKYAEENDLELTLLADPGNEASKAYGTWYESGVNARVSFIVSRDQEIVRVYADQRVRSHIKEMYTNAKETLVE